MSRIGIAVLFALFCLPRCAVAQTTPPTTPPVTQGQADLILQQCENTNDDLPEDPELAICYAQHANAGIVALKNQHWKLAINEETAAIVLLVTYRQRLFGKSPSQIPVAADNMVLPYLLRSAAYTEIKQYDLALSDAAAAITYDPANASTWNNRCCLHAVTGNLPAAFQDCGQALKLAPKNAAILDSTGFVYLKMKNYPASAINYDAALKIQPKLASSLYGRGLGEQADGHADQGGRDIAAAAQIDPKITTDFGSLVSGN